MLYLNVKKNLRKKTEKLNVDHVYNIVYIISTTKSDQLTKKRFGHE